MAHDVFISYPQQDKKTADAVCCTEMVRVMRHDRSCPAPRFA